MSTQDINNYIDSNGLIIHGYKADGGDSCANTFTALYACTVTSTACPISASKALNALVLPSGQPIRHPDSTKWYSSPDTTSRDQLRPYIYYLGAAAQSVPTVYLNKLVALLAPRFFFSAWNIYHNGSPLGATGKKRPDILGPEIWASLLRAYTNRYTGFIKYALLMALYVPLTILDVQLLIGSVIDRVLYYTKYHDNDQRNAALGIHYANLICPTPSSIASKLIYGKDIITSSATQFWALDADEPPMHQYVLKLYR